MSHSFHAYAASLADDISSLQVLSRPIQSTSKKLLKGLNRCTDLPQACQGLLYWPQSLTLPYTGQRHVLYGSCNYKITAECCLLM